jgi:hypothetical protein
MVSWMFGMPFIECLIWYTFELEFDFLNEFKFNNGGLPPLTVNWIYYKKVNGKINSVNSKGGVCLFKENLREVNVSFKTTGGVSVIFIDLEGGECNFLNL